MSLEKSTRRRLAKRGLRAIRFPGNDPDDYRVGGYIIVDVRTNFAVFGTDSGLEYLLSADDVREIAADVPGSIRAVWGPYIAAAA